MKKNLQLLSLSGSLAVLLSGCGPGYYYNDQGDSSSNIGGGGTARRYVVLNAIDDDGAASCGSTGGDGARIFAYTTNASDNGQLTPMLYGDPLVLNDKGGIDAGFRGINVSPDGYCYYPYLSSGGKDRPLAAGFEALRYKKGSIAISDQMEDLGTYQCDNGPSFASSPNSYYNYCDDVVAYPNPNLGRQFVVSTGKPYYSSTGSIWIYPMNTNTKCQLNSPTTTTYPATSKVPWAATFNDEPTGSTITVGSYLFTLAYNTSKFDSSLNGAPEIRSWSFSPSGTISSLSTNTLSTLFSAVINRELLQVSTTSQGGCLFLSYNTPANSTIYTAKYSFLGTLSSVGSTNAPSGKKISSLNVNDVSDSARYLYATMRDGTVYRYLIDTTSTNSSLCTLGSPTQVASTPSFSAGIIPVPSINVFHTTGILKMPPKTSGTTEYAYEGLGYTNTFPVSYLRSFQFSFPTYSFINLDIYPPLSANSPDKPTNGVAVGAPN